MAQSSISILLFINIVNRIVGQELSALLSPVVSSTCMKLGICEMVDNYPTQLARKLIKELKDRDTIIADDPVLETTHRQPIFRIIGGRYPDNSNEDSDEIRLCESTIEYQNPKIAENINNEWKFILNDEEEPVQTFRAERCNSRRSQCSKEMSFIPNYEGVCIQRWTLKEMYYINKDGNSATDYFKVPTCCSCRLLHMDK